MKIKIINFLILLMIHYGLCLDVKNCTNSTDAFTSFPPNPKMKFYLFTNKNFFAEQQIFINNKSSLINSNFNSQWPVRIIVHGWRSKLLSCFNAYVKDAYLKKGTFNVFVVDWGNWAQNINYFEIVPYISDSLGPLLSEFIKFLNIDGNILYDNIYLIGHSMGAHLSGSAGANLGENKVNTIFGLDPAGPGFQGASINNRLDPSDAKYVEQIQTNMGEAGYTGVIGHGAFFPNYGRIQPYCIRYELSDPACSHSAAYWYFAESINTSIGFCSKRCPFYFAILIGIGCFGQCPTGAQKILMGGEPSIPKSGTFYLITNDKRDFAICKC